MGHIVAIPETVPEPFRFSTQHMKVPIKESEAFGGGCVLKPAILILTPRFRLLVPPAPNRRCLGSRLAPRVTIDIWVGGGEGGHPIAFSQSAGPCHRAVPIPL